MRPFLFKISSVLIVIFFLVYHATAQGSDIDTSICPNETVILSTENISGSIYQWQVNTGKGGFIDLTDDSNYTNTDIPSITIANVPSSWYGYRYRCLVDGVADDTFNIHFASRWLGVTDNWSGTVNWSCGQLPDANTDVIIDPAGDLVIVDVNAICRSMQLNPNASLRVDPGNKLTVTH